MLLKATEKNWSLHGPGDWDKRTWKINEDGTYLLKTAYLPDDTNDPIPEQEEEGELSSEKLELLLECIDSYWTDEPGESCDDGVAWEFKLYQDGNVIRHRELGYIDGLEPYESLAALLYDDIEIDD